MTGGRSRSRRHFISSSEMAAHNQATEAQKSKVLDQFDAIKGAMISMAASSFQNFIGELVPGFQQHLEQAQRDKQRTTMSGAASAPPRAASTAAH